MENIAETLGRSTGEAKQLILDSKNIYLITSQGHEGRPEAIACALALFYTLKDLGKNVNLLIDSLPESLKFLSPSLDFISYPKNFVLSIPDSVAKISQIHYEKNPDALKIHLKLESGNIKKDNISFYFSEPKPDLIITIGVKDYQKELSERLDSYGFLLDAPIVNIDSGQDNKKFGKINIVEEKPLAELIINLINGKDPVKNKGQAACLLSAMAIYTENFKKNITAEVFQISADLMRAGADLKEITENLNK
jgi:nanoRNase/pAp phosphatase (c-di-AMP/oligoRNAs hydrolase)